MSSDAPDILAKKLEVKNQDTELLVTPDSGEILEAYERVVPEETIVNSADAEDMSSVAALLVVVLHGAKTDIVRFNDIRSTLKKVDGVNQVDINAAQEFVESKNYVSKKNQHIHIGRPHLNHQLTEAGQEVLSKIVSG